MLTVSRSTSATTLHLRNVNIKWKRRLVTHNTVEERMLAVSRKKLVLERVVVQTAADASLRQARRPACSVLWENIEGQWEKGTGSGSRGLCECERSGFFSERQSLQMGRKWEPEGGLRVQLCCMSWKRAAGS